MLIKCSKNVGNWFDEISILNVKINRCEGSKKQQSLKNFEKLAKEIKEQIGENLYREIMAGEYYYNLYNENLKIFILIDKLNIHKKENNLENWELAELGIKINDLNFSRFEAKNKLQKKYFNSEVSEIKVGY